MAAEYSYTELSVLWYLKRHGPLVAVTASPRDSLVTRLVNDLNIRRKSISWALNRLEERCVILRTYQRAEKQRFNDGTGYNPLLRLELVDPAMALSPCPPPVPLAVVVAHENSDMYEHQAHEPTAEAIVEALLSRINELQSQVDKLQDIVAQQAEAMSKATKDQKASVHHLTERIQAALTPEQWEALRHRGQR